MTGYGDPTGLYNPELSFNVDAMLNAFFPEGTETTESIDGHNVPDEYTMKFQLYSIAHYHYWSFLTFQLEISI